MGKASEFSKEMDSWKEEKQSAFLYRVLAEYEKGNRCGQLFEKLSQAADRQALTWEKTIRGKAKDGVLPDFSYSPSLRVLLVARLVPVFGPRPLTQILTALKLRGLSVYAAIGTAHENSEPGTPENLHRSMSTGGNLRAAVFGVNDGLVSNACLILGVGAASVDTHAVLLTGTAGMIAGALSMASGEYISVRSQRELFEYQMALEEAELEEYPEEEAQELALIYEAKGIEKEEASRIAHQIVKNPKKALDTLAREELGLNPDELGSPWLAALSSFVCFALGAFIPLLPFVALKGERLLTYSASLSVICLFVVGSTLSLFTGRSVLWSGIRMVLIGAASAAVSFFVGSRFGA